jgi:hypothetical protein
MIPCVVLSLFCIGDIALAVPRCGVLPLVDPHALDEIDPESGDESSSEMARATLNLSPVLK